MAVHLKKLQDQVIVITGASSGIGLATARMAAQHGAKVALIGRNEEALSDLVAEIEGSGGDAMYVIADVADADAVERAGQEVLDRYGRFDTWVNNAGVSIYGRLDEQHLEEKRRLMDVNFWGVVHGCRIAVPFLRQHGGSIINVGSVLSDRAIPLQGMYCATKHAVKAYTDTLRMELEEAGAPISVTLVKPGAIATPYYRHAANHMDAAPKPARPLYSPDAVARAILACAERPVRDVFVGGSAKMISWLGTHAPRLTDRVMEKTMFESQKYKGRAPEGRAASNLFRAPSDDGQAQVDYGVHVAERSLYTDLVLSRARAALLLVAAGSLLLGYRRILGDRPQLLERFRARMRPLGRDDRAQALGTDSFSRSTARTAEPMTVSR